MFDSGPSKLDAEMIPLRLFFDNVATGFMESLHFLNITFSQLPGGKSIGPGGFSCFYISLVKSLYIILIPGAKLDRHRGTSTWFIANNVKTEEELMVKAQKQFAEGKKDLKKFIISKSLKSLQDLTKRGGGGGRKAKCCEFLLFSRFMQKIVVIFHSMKQLQIYSTFKNLHKRSFKTNVTLKISVKLQC